MDARKHTRDWLDAEQDGREDLAELTFARLMSELPPVEASPDFVGAVVHRAMRVQARRRAVRSLARVAAVLVISAASVAGIYMFGLFAIGVLGRGTSLFADGLLWLAQSAGDGFRWWSLFARVGTAVGQSLITPRTAAAIVIIELLGASAIYAFQRVLQGEHGQDSRQVQI